MISKDFKRFLIVAAVTLLPLFSVAQDNNPDKLGAPNVQETGNGGNKLKMSANEKKAAATKAKQKKDADKMYKAAVKQHAKNQSKNTRTMMKASKKKSDKINDKGSKHWWQKIF